MLKSKTTSVDYIARKLDEIEHELIKLNDMLGNKEQELRELDGLKEAIEETKPLIAKLQHHDGETYKLRSMIASRLRRIVHRISVAPLGQAPDIRESIEGLRARKLPDSDKTADFWERELGKEERWHHRFFEVRFNDKQVLPGTGSESEQSYTTLVVYSSDDDPTRVRIGSDLWHHDETEMVDYDEKPSWGGWY
jgi:hypothetical protein